MNRVCRPRALVPGMSPGVVTTQTTHAAPTVIDHPANVSTIRTVFPLQSFFDDTALQNALLVQDPNNPIVASTQNSRQIKGRLIGLHPASETPITMRIYARGDASGADVVNLSPGEILRVKTHGFYNIDWGIPFGWLGGGLAQLVIADNEDAYMAWPEQQSEVLVQRQRIQIVADADPSTTPLVNAANWPVRFPWTNAFKFNASGVSSQRGSPLFAPEPSRVRLRLRVNNLAAPAQMRIIAQGFDDWDLGADGLTIAFTDFTAEDRVQWPTASGTSAPYPMIEILDGLLLDGGDQAVVTFTDLGNAELTDEFVDVLRYGKL